MMMGASASISSSPASSTAGAIGAERWSFAIEDGYYKLDNIRWISAPADLLDGAIEVDVTMIDYAFALSQSTIPANVPVNLYVTNTSFSMSGHIAILVSCQDITPEQLITGERDGESECMGMGFLAPSISSPARRVIWPSLDWSQVSTSCSATSITPPACRTMNSG